MRLLPAIVLSAAIAAFAQAPPGSPSQGMVPDFDVFCRFVADDYAYFDIKQTQWDKVCTRFGPRAAVANDREALIPVLEAALAELYDFSGRTLDRSLAVIRFNNSLGNDATINAFDAARASLKDLQGLILDLRDALVGAPVIGTLTAKLLGALREVRLPASSIVVCIPTEKLFHVHGTPREAFVPCPVVVPASAEPGADPPLLAAIAILATPATDPTTRSTNQQCDGPRSP